MKAHTLTHQQRTKSPPGFASLLTVVSVGIGLLIIMISMYQNTVESQSVQKNNLLKNDYMQREEAFLRALTNIIPNHAMLCMQDGSSEGYWWGSNQSLRWNAIFDTAMAQSNSESAVSDSVAESLGIGGRRSGNVANTSLNSNTVIRPLSGADLWDVTSGTNLEATTSFPPPLECSEYNKFLDRLYPIISHKKIYGSSATGWVQAPVDEYPLYNLVEAPKLHFHYTNSPTLIAKHNWWAFELSFADQDKSNTKLTGRKKKYLISLYEIPSQLPISSSTYTTFGAHSDGTEWSNITLNGGIFAEKVKTEGSFSTQAISSRQGVRISTETTVNGTVTGSNAGSNPFASQTRELTESRGEVFPISSASDGGRVAFVPINRGLDFYDHFIGSNDSIDSADAVSPTSWDYYSIGAKQCRMRLDIIDVVSASDQTPTQIRFSYWEDTPDDGLGPSQKSQIFSKGDNWPDPSEPEGETFPFHVDNSATGRACIAVYAERLTAWLNSNNAGLFDINKSLSINADYNNNTSIPKPSFPSVGGDIAVMLLNAKDMTSYTSGFSMVCNMQLIIADDVNVIPTTPPSGVVVPSGKLYYPPISFFAPEKRYGDSGIPLKIDIDGQLGSLAKGNVDPVRIVDLKSGAAEQIVPENITANLTSINHPAGLPPINLMNWMIVIREIHPKFVPEEIN